MTGISPVNGAKLGISAINTGRTNSDNSHAYIASRINDLYVQALNRQQATFGTRSLKRFIDSKTSEGKKFDQFG